MEKNEMPIVGASPRRIGRRLRPRPFNAAAHHPPRIGRRPVQASVAWDPYEPVPYVASENPYDTSIVDDEPELMTDRFEMSMMGEMRFFLGFEIKQLREGTFINQAKYLQDMLKRFKMTEMKGVATPMVTKCHLALDPNGGSKKRGKGHVEDEEEEEFELRRPSKLTARQQAAQKNVKSPIVRGKRVHVSVKNMPYLEYKELRQGNPYLIPRNNRVADKRFHNKSQEEIFYEIYVTFKKAIVTQHSIETAKMTATRYFDEAYALCGEFGLYPMMELNKDFDIGLIQQFYATVHFQQDEARTFRWMTHETLLEANLASFGEALGYPRSPIVNANGWQSHDSSFALTKDVLEPLYIKGWGVPGKSADFLPTWDIMLRVYREMIGPKGGNLDELHTYEVDLMANSHAKQGTGENLDVMDYIYNEMWTCVMEKKFPLFAPFIMKLIEDTWISTRQDPLAHSIPLNITAHEVKSLRVKRHNSPIEDVPPLFMRSHQVGSPSLPAACNRSFVSPQLSTTVSISNILRPRSLGFVRRAS
ncbi:hypothetical protein QYE76_054801 [Lolium multiflorum]|uniref:Reverse transcriptase Ty1/copia-type domain-containing protein n=1 Tax=Lolium multiflorum TaxID=4521 RepID=A0AAD8SYN0_LOLMU|nr:hypothetical protein QYE76_054801 [Lolium multiflorum]